MRRLLTTPFLPFCGKAKTAGTIAAAPSGNSRGSVFAFLRKSKNGRRIPRARSASREAVARGVRPQDDDGRFFCRCKKNGRRRPTLARPGDALPSAMEPLTSVFGMGTGMAAPPWPPAEVHRSGKAREPKRTATRETRRGR